MGGRVSLGGSPEISWVTVNPPRHKIEVSIIPYCDGYVHDRGDKAKNQLNGFGRNGDILVAVPRPARFGKTPPRFSLGSCEANLDSPAKFQTLKRHILYRIFG